jgi:hypothetical protein
LIPAWAARTFLALSAARGIMNAHAAKEPDHAPAPYGGGGYYKKKKREGFLGELFDFD